MDDREEQQTQRLCIAAYNGAKAGVVNAAVNVMALGLVVGLGYYAGKLIAPYAVQFAARMKGAAE